MAAWALLALLIPCSIYTVLYKTPFVFHLLGYALLGSMAETVFMFVVKRKRRLICSGSALTAALLAASVPASMPFIPLLFAILFAVWLIKLPMTGLPLRFNAAMAGRLFLMLAYPVQVTNWGTPTPDVISTATPQELYRSEGFALEWPRLLFGKIEGKWEELFLLVPGSPGETFPLILLLIGILLFRKRIIAWRTPVAYLLSFGVVTWAFGQSPLVNMFTAATVFSAVFIVSDPVSTPVSKSGQIACGIIMGISNICIRHFTYYTDATVYAVLIGNLFTPLLDRISFELQGRRLERRLNSSS